MPRKYEEYSLKKLNQKTAFPKAVFLYPNIYSRPEYFPALIIRSGININVRGKYLVLYTKKSRRLILCLKKIYLQVLQTVECH